MDDIQATCYPSLHAQFSKYLQVRGDSSLVPIGLRLRLMVTSLEALGEPETIYGNVVSDAFIIDNTLTDSRFSYTLYVVVDPPSANNLPEFATPLEKLQIQAERAFTYTLPEIIDPQIPD